MKHTITTLALLGLCHSIAQRRCRRALLAHGRAPISAISAVVWVPRVPPLLRWLGFPRGLALPLVSDRLGVGRFPLLGLGGGGGEQRRRLGLCGDGGGREQLLRAQDRRAGQEGRWGWDRDSLHLAGDDGAGDIDIDALTPPSVLV
jgi:hypothetical protein